MRGGAAWEERIPFINSVWRNKNERETGRVSPWEVQIAR
jgi:hypothetical protein